MSDRSRLVTLVAVNAILMLALSRRLAATGEARRRRLDAAVSLREMAHAVGVSASTILRWERAERSPHGDAAIRYGELLEQLGAAEIVDAAS